MQHVRWLLFACLAWLALATPSLAGISQISGTGTGGAIVSTVFNAGATLNMTTTHDIPPGSLAIALVQSQSTGTHDYSCSDTYGNTYSAGQAVATLTGANSKIIYSYTAFDIPNAGTITCSVTTGTSGLVGTVLAFSGSSPTPYDSASATAVTGTATGTLTVGPTGTLNGPCTSASCEVLVGAIITHNNGTVTMDSNFTAVSGLAGSGFINGFWIVSTSTIRVFSPSTTATSSGWAGQLQGFMAGSTTVTARHRLILQ